MNFQGRKCKDYFSISPIDYVDFTDIIYWITLIIKMITPILFFETHRLLK
jgi:hypothetical protein